jgi:hypothetical protein
MSSRPRSIGGSSLTNRCTGTALRLAHTGLNVFAHVDKSPPILKTDLGSYKPEPERTAEDYPLLGIDLD